uniref:Uncharacterized protein n=1 Tax=Panagrolaimus davidi TaxID=227884 RepID=A0A914P4R8_9BILA
MFFVSLCFTAGNLDVESVYNFMKSNQEINFILRFSRPLSLVDKNKFKLIVEEIISSKSFDYKPRCIEYNGQDYSKKTKKPAIHYQFQRLCSY